MLLTMACPAVPDPPPDVCGGDRTSVLAYLGRAHVAVLGVFVAEQATFNASTRHVVFQLHSGEYRVATDALGACRNNFPNAGNRRQQWCRNPRGGFHSPSGCARAC